MSRRSSHIADDIMREYRIKKKYEQKKKLSKEDFDRNSNDALNKMIEEFIDDMKEGEAEAIKTEKPWVWEARQEQGRKPQKNLKNFRKSSWQGSEVLI